MIKANKQKRHNNMLQMKNNLIMQDIKPKTKENTGAIVKDDVEELLLQKYRGVQQRMVLPSEVKPAKQLALCCRRIGLQALRVQSPCHQGIDHLQEFHHGTWPPMRHDEWLGIFARA